MLLKSRNYIQHHISFVNIYVRTQKSGCPNSLRIVKFVLSN